MSVPTNCSSCGDKLRNAAGWQTGQCETCRGNVPDWMWWKKGLPMFVVAYPDIASLNEQAAVVSSDYSIASMAAMDGHVNLGATALGWTLAGPLGVAAANNRTEGAIIVAWERRA